MQAEPNRSCLRVANRVGQFVRVVRSGREVGGKQLTDAFDRLHETFGRAVLSNPLYDHIDVSLPLLGIDPFVDPPISENFDSSLPLRQEDEDTAPIAGLEHSAIEEVRFGACIDGGGSGVCRHEHPHERGPTEDQVQRDRRRDLRQKEHPARDHVDVAKREHAERHRQCACGSEPKPGIRVGGRSDRDDDFAGGPRLGGSDGCLDLRFVTVS